MYNVWLQLWNEIPGLMTLGVVLFCLSCYGLYQIMKGTFK